MSDNIVNIMSDSKSDTYFTLRMYISLDSYLPHIDHGHLVPEVIPLSDDSDSERIHGDSEGTSLSNSLEAFTNCRRRG